MTYRDDRSRAELELRSKAANEGLTEPERKAYMPLALALLDTTTVEEAARYQVTPADYAAWRQNYPRTGR